MWNPFRRFSGSGTSSPSDESTRGPNMSNRFSRHGDRKVGASNLTGARRQSAPSLASRMAMNPRDTIIDYPRLGKHGSFRTKRTRDRALPAMSRQSSIDQCIPRRRDHDDLVISALTHEQRQPRPRSSTGDREHRKIPSNKLINQQQPLSAPDLSTTTSSNEGSPCPRVPLFSRVTRSISTNNAESDSSGICESSSLIESGATSLSSLDISPRSRLDKDKTLTPKDSPLTRKAFQAIDENTLASSDSSDIIGDLANSKPVTKQITVVDRRATLVPGDSTPDLDSPDSLQPRPPIPAQPQAYSPYDSPRHYHQRDYHRTPTYNIAATSLPNSDQEYAMVNTVSYAEGSASEIERSPLPPPVLTSHSYAFIDVINQSDEEIRMDILGLCERLENALAGGNWRTVQNIHHKDMTAFLPDVPISLVNFNNPCTAQSIEKMYKLDRSGKYGIQKARSIILEPISTRIMAKDTALVNYRRVRQQILADGMRTVKTKRSEITRLFTRNEATNHQWKCIHWHETCHTEC